VLNVVLNGIAVAVCLLLLAGAIVAGTIALFGAKSIRKRAAGISGLCVLALAGAITQTVSGWRTSEPVKTTSSSQTNPSASDASTTAPDPESTAAVVSPGGSVPMCTTFEGTANLADGYGLAIASQKQGPNRWYFEGRVHMTEGGRRWSAEIELGDPEDGGGEYVVRPVILPNDWLRYLSGTQEDRDDTYWSSEDLPPLGVFGPDFPVHRSDNKPC
jgi:hypothetical protein